MPAWTAPCPPEARVSAVTAISLRERRESQPLAFLCRLVGPDLCWPGRRQVTAPTHCWQQQRPVPFTLGVTRRAGTDTRLAG